MITPVSAAEHTQPRKKEVRLHVHHLESRKVGGNAPDNQVTLCESCHEKLHKGLIAEKRLQKRKRRLHTGCHIHGHHAEDFNADALL
ncbi:MAG: HNH endonuclease [Dysosmobacter sp.]